jgi:hypothetical protein
LRVLQELVYGTVLEDRDHVAPQVAGRIFGFKAAFRLDGAQEDVLDVYRVDYAVGESH